MLFRFFPYDPDAAPHLEGGPLFVPRVAQGAGRHDAPDLYGALYASREPVSVVAEFIKRFQRQTLESGDLWWAPGRPHGLAMIDDAALPHLVDLDDPAILSERGTRPSAVATGRREITQRWARAVHFEGALGFEWWSTIEASWINVTLFAERAVPQLSVAEEPEPLTIGHPAVIEAAEAVGVRLA